MSDVGCVFTFEVDPRDTYRTEEAMRAIFDAMAEEEFPTGDVKTYTAFRDPENAGKWMMFEHFTSGGADRHATGAGMMEAGLQLTSHFTAPFSRTVLEPVFYAGLGESIAARRPY